MNRWMINVLMGACLCAAACGGDGAPQTSISQVDTDQGAGTDTGTTNGSGGDSGNGSGPTASPAKLQLLLRGADAGSLTSVRLRVKSVEIRAGATVLASVGAMQEMDLAMVSNAFLLTTFQAPAGTEQLEFTIAFDSASVEMANGNFEVDASCEVLKLGGKVSLVAQRNHAVVLLDLARSFVKVGTAMVLVPQLQLVY
jgi:hypothetical protein